MATPFMALTLPTPSVSTGPGWASTLNTAFTTVDSHDHTSGKGVPVPISGLNVNADLPMTTGTTNFNITGVRALRLVNLTATPTVSTDIGEIVNSGGNLYWMNSSGQAVQITAGAALSATSLGGISGLPSGTASAAFASQTFTWRSATNTAATMDAGPVLIRDTALGALAITIASPTALASAYTLTLPTAVPASSKLLSISSGGVASYADVDNSTLQNSSGTLSIKAAGVGSTQLGSLAVGTSNIAANAVTPAKMGSVYALRVSSAGATLSSKGDTTGVSTSRIGTGSYTLTDARLTTSTIVVGSLENASGSLDVAGLFAGSTSILTLNTAGTPTDTTFHLTVWI